MPPAEPLTAASRVDVIVNADDLGVSREVNEATFGLMAEGHVTSATILANGPAFEEAVRCVAKFPQCSFGAHLNLIEFEPLCRQEAELLADGGVMSRRRLNSRVWHPYFLRAAYRELSAQIARLMESGVPVSHLDSHQHVHTIPWMFPVIKALQTRFGIRLIRRSRNIYSASQPITKALQYQKSLYNWALSSVYTSQITAGFTDLPTLLEMKAETARKFRSIEIMVHPGSGVLEAEVRLLQANCLRSLPFRTRLINYRQLGAHKHLIT